MVPMNKANRFDAFVLARFRSLLRRVESGSMEGGTYAEIVYEPFFITIVLLGVILAMVGFWRVGASYAAQTAAQIGAVAPSEGNAALADVWVAWTQANAPTNGFQVDVEGRTVRARISTSASFNSNMFGPLTFAITAGTNTSTRSERFYPGQPVCDVNGCHE